MQQTKINRETYVSYNLQKLDRLRDDEPHWLEYYSAAASDNVAANLVTEAMESAMIEASSSEAMIELAVE